MKITFFVGNGFDLNQNLKTSYPNFLNNYLNKNANDSLEVVEFKKHLKNHDCWSDLEIALGNMLCEYDESNVDNFSLVWIYFVVVTQKIRTRECADFLLFYFSLFTFH